MPNGQSLGKNLFQNNSSCDLYLSIALFKKGYLH